MVQKFRNPDRSFAQASLVDYGNMKSLDLDESSVALLDNSLNHSQAQ